MPGSRPGPDKVGIFDRDKFRPVTIQTSGRFPFRQYKQVQRAQTTTRKDNTESEQQKASRQSPQLGAAPTALTTRIATFPSPLRAGLTFAAPPPLNANLILFLP